MLHPNLHLPHPLPSLSPLLSEKPQNPQVVQSCHKGGAISPAEDKVTHITRHLDHSPHHSLSIRGEEQNWLPFCPKGTHSDALPGVEEVEGSVSENAVIKGKPDHGSVTCDKAPTPPQMLGGSWDPSCT